jgi:hypothetical protein
MVVVLLASLEGVARADSDPCGLSTVSQPFLGWADLAYYERVPGGDFENGTWTFNGGARRVPGSEPYAATGKIGNWSLSLRAGSFATSPSVCVAVTEPSIRFFIVGTGTVAVDFMYGGKVIPAALVAGTSDWAPSPVVLTGTAITAASSGTTDAAVKFVGLSGDAQVDDVFIDPWNRG